MTTNPGPSGMIKKRGKLCAVAFCRNYETEGVGFFRFPRERDLRQLWVERCGRKDPINVPNARICSAHFEKNDFVPDLKAQLMGTKPLRRLVKGAVPSLNLDLMTGSSKSDDSANRSKHMENLVECIIIESLPLEPKSEESKYITKRAKFIGSKPIRFKANFVCEDKQDMEFIESEGISLKNNHIG